MNVRELNRFGYTALASGLLGQVNPAQKWIVDPNDRQFIGSIKPRGRGTSASYIPLLCSGSLGKIVDTIDQIDLNPYILTKYEVNDYVLKRFPSTKIWDGNPDKYGSYCRKPYIVTKVLSMQEVYGPTSFGTLFATSRMERSTPLKLPTCSHFTSILRL